MRPLQLQQPDGQRLRHSTLIPFLRRLVSRLWPSRHVALFYDPAYRLPSTTVAVEVGFEPRRADLALWYLESRGRITPEDVHAPPRITYEDLARVHTSEWLESLSAPGVLAGVFGLEPWDVPVDSTLDAIRLSCGGTLAAARLALEGGGPCVNLLGGFHHAHPARGAGHCPVNDVAVAVATLRAEGFRGRVNILDLDAHPPDGTAACLKSTVWHGSLSGADWGPLPDVDETVLPDRAGDAVYLAALDALLKRMPSGDLAFVLAGGDVLAGDPLGNLGLTLAGTAERDLRVSKALGKTPAVWLPAGGYQADCWKVVVGTLHVLMRGRAPRISSRADPLRDRFRRVADSFPTDRLGSPDEPLNRQDLEEIEAELGGRRPVADRLLGYYTAQGLEYALFRVGVLGHLERLGYGRFRVEIRVDATEPGDRVRLWGHYADEAPTATGHVLIEAMLERKAREPFGPVLYVHWLALRHPRVAFARGRPALPGQDVPGLGLAREAQELLGNMARRLGLRGVVVRPAYFHIAYVGRDRYRFLNPDNQGDFDALVRDLLADRGLRATDETFLLGRASREVDAGHIRRVRLDKETGAETAREVYVWPADELLDPLETGGADAEFEARRAEVAATTRFERAPPV